ncbi:unnamed protein product [Lupinus luteus]|uniref:Uncharacterized protein n=1 Tax=Lupinus luteus TaxID=3873 RepID=A0AAV1YKA3_LUPLU
MDKVNKISPKFQDGLKAFSDSPIIGEIIRIFGEALKATEERVKELESQHK